MIRAWECDARRAGRRRIWAGGAPGVAPERTGGMPLPMPSQSAGRAASPHHLGDGVSTHLRILANFAHQHANRPKLILDGISESKQRSASPTRRTYSFSVRFLKRFRCVFSLFGRVTGQSLFLQNKADFWGFGNSEGVPDFFAMSAVYEETPQNLLCLAYLLAGDIGGNEAGNTDRGRQTFGGRGGHEKIWYVQSNSAGTHATNKNRTDG
jgi:hypothetical protein